MRSNRPAAPFPLDLWYKGYVVTWLDMFAGHMRTFFSAQLESEEVRNPASRNGCGTWTARANYG